MVSTLHKRSFLKYLFIFLVFIGQNSIFSQTCNVSVNTSIPSGTYVCPGTVVNLSATATVYADNSSFNFDAGTLPTGWSVAGGASFGSPCGPGPGGSHFWASTAGSGVPFIQTAGFDICSGGSIVFDMRYAVQGGSSPCEGPDEPDEGVSIEYSLDGGATWIEFVYFHPNGTTLGANPGGNSPTVSGATPWTTWSTITVPIPGAAISGNTIFRWVQTNSSGTCCDNWGIDNVFINAGPCLNANINWSTGQNGVDNIATPITSDTCIRASVYDDLGNFLCSSTTRCYGVFIPSIDAGPDQTVCNGASVTLSGSGGSGFTWDNAVVNGVPFVPPLGTTTYTVNGTDVNGCPATDQVNVTVNPIAPPTMNPAGPVCIDGGLIALSGSPAGGVFTGTGVTGTNFNPAIAGAGTHTITYTYTTGGCSSSTTRDIIVNPLPVVSINPQASLCLNAAPVNLIGNPAGGTFSGAGLTGSSFNPSTAGVGTHTITYTFTDGNGCTNSNTRNITVNPLNTIAAGINRTTCVNSAITNITLATTSATGATFSGLPAGVTGSWTGNLATISGTPTVAGTYNYTVTTTGGCPPATTTGTITVTPLNTIAAGTNQTVCINSAITNITMATTGATGATFAGLPAGVTGSWAGNVATISGTPSVSGTFNYTVTTTGGCPPATTTGTITVTPLNTIAPGTNQTVCINSAITNISLATTGATGATFAGLPAGVTGSWAGNVATISGTPSVAGTFNYTVTTTGGCPPATTTGTITVTPLNTIAAGTNQTVCATTAITNITLATTGATGATFAGLPAGVTGSWAGNVVTIGGTPTVPGVYNYTVTTTGGCPPATTTGIITVNSLPTGTTSGTTDVCQNGAAPNITFTGANGVAPYTFTYTINGGAPQTVTTVGASSTATVSVPTGTAGTFVYALTGVQDASSTTCSNPQVDSETVIVNPLPTASTIGTTDVCQNGAAPNITFTGANGTAPYTFTYTINGAGPYYVSSVGASSTATVSVPTGTVGTFVYALTGVQDASSTTCSNPQVDSETVTVNPLPTASTIGTIAVCQNGAAPNITFTGANGTAPYTFTYTINGGAPLTVSSVGASSTATVSVPTAVAGTFTYALTGVQDASSTTCSNPQVDSEVVTVNPLPTASTSGTTDVCQNGAAPNITFTGANGTAPYTFTYTINGGAPQTVSSVGASSTATVSVPTGTVGTFTYALTGVQDASSTTCSNPQVDSEIVTVNPLPTASTSGSIDVCQNGTPPNITFTGANGTAPYTFTYTINGGAPQTVSSVGASPTATVSVPTGTAGTFVYELTGVQDASSTTCYNPQTDSETVLVNPLSAASTSGSTAACQNGVSPVITFTGFNGSAPYTFTYTINGGAPLTVSSVGASTTATVSVPTGSAGTFVYDLISVMDASSTSCSNPQVDSEIITINPLPTGTSSGTIDVCQNATSPVITFTGANGTAPYTFSYTINNGVTMYVSSVGASNTATVSVPTGTAGTFVYELISVQDASSTTCSNPQVDTETVIVNPLPTASTSGTTAVCQDATAPVVTFTGANGTAPYTFTYTINGGAALTVSTTGGSSSATVTVPTNVPGTFVYDLVSVQDASSTSCVNPQVDSETITVNPLPTATIAGNIDVCHNDVFPDVTFTGANGTAPYTFTYIINGGTPQTVSSTGANNSVTVPVPTGTPGTYVYELTGVQDGSSTTCSNAQTGTVTVNVYAYPPIDAGSDQLICENSSTVLNATNPMGVPFYWDNGVIDGVPFSPSQSTTYTVTADNHGCLSTDDVYVEIEPLPTVIFSGDTLQGCEPVVVNFTSSSSSPFGVANCVWDFGDGNQYVGCGGASNTFEDPGYYSVTLTVTSNNGCVNSATYADYVYVEAYPIVEFSPGYAHVTTLSTTVEYENNTIGGSTYVWNFGDGSPESTQVHPTHTFPDETSENFTVRLIATSPIGCVDTAYGYVDVKEELIYYIPNTFTPDGDDYNETFRPVFTDGYDPYSYTMLIFNRWGEIVWESHDTQVGWDGNYGGIPVQDGTYTWKIDFKTSYDDERIMDTGHVNVIRGGTTK